MFGSNSKDLGCAIFLTILLIGNIQCSPFLNIFNCEEDSYYPHPYKCSQYFECISGTFYLRECDDNYEFDSRYEKCVEAEDSNCLIDEYTTTEPDCTSTPEATTEEKCVNYEKYPHETKCDRFYMCLGGDMYEMECPRPLHFNTHVKECDLPEIANCQIFTTTTNMPCIDFKFYPHPYDCRKYFQCLSGELYLMQCPEKWAYNPIRETCDFPHMVHCPTTPAKCENYKKYPHEIDCNKYYYCINESLFLMSCHEELHFYWKIQDCDTPENAMCEIETR